MTSSSLAKLTVLLTGIAVLLAGLTVAAAVKLSGPASAHQSSSLGVAVAQVEPGGAEAAPAAGEVALPGTEGPAAELGAPPAAAPEVDLPALDPLSPLLPYRENPFVARPPSEDPGLVRLPGQGVYVTPEDREIWNTLRRSNMEFYKAYMEANFGRSFAWGSTHFPRPRSVLQPAGEMGSELLLPPARPILAGEGVAVTGATGGAAEGGPRPEVGAQETSAVEARTTPKTGGARIRRVTGIVHDGTAAAIIEIEDAGQVETRVVKPGAGLEVGGRQYRVRSIGETGIVLLDAATNEELSIPLRGRTVNEE